MTRPFFKDTVASLELIVKQYCGDLDILGQVDEELQHRSTSRAKDLKVEVAEFIKKEKQDADERTKFREKSMKTSTAVINEAGCSGQGQPDTFLKEFSNSIGD